MHAEDYALVISQHSTMRRLIQAASRISELGYGGSDNVDATIRKAEDALFAVRGTTPTRDFVPLRDIYDEYLQEQASTIDAGNIQQHAGDDGLSGPRRNPGRSAEGRYDHPRCEAPLWGRRPWP